LYTPYKKFIGFYITHHHILMRYFLHGHQIIGGNKMICGPLTKLRLINLKTWPPIFNEKWFFVGISVFPAFGSLLVMLETMLNKFTE